MSEIINRVALSPLVTIDLEELYPKGKRVVYDMKDNLFEGLILKEKDFRAFVRSQDWSQYEGSNVAITCSAEAIVPTWAYMLLATKLEGTASHVVFGSLEDLENSLFQKLINELSLEEYKDKKIVIKGCADLPIPTFAYVELTRVLKPIAKSLMYGEPCSTVPLFKKR